ncbi:hypothetical protein QZH41_010383 [Actinostola sp. cb2023]|nr:hypothetical protein QZH41_010383 [Actinostola sp. cb2023]
MYCNISIEDIIKCIKKKKEKKKRPIYDRLPQGDRKAVFGYLLVDNKPDTPADKQVLGDISGGCHVYLFATKTRVNSSVEPAPVSDIETSWPGRKQSKLADRYITWSDEIIPVLQNFTSGAQAVRNIPEGYHIEIKCTNLQPGHMKWVRLHEDEPTVRAFVEETDKDLRGNLTPAV